MVGMDLVIANAHLVASLGFGLFALATDLKEISGGPGSGISLSPPGLYLIGLMATLATQSPDPSGVVMNLMLKFGWAIPALIIILFSTFTTTFLDIYSTAISGLKYFSKLGERTGIWIGGILGIIVAIIFPTLLNYEHFLLFIGPCSVHSSGSFSLITS